MSKLLDALLIGGTILTGTSLVSMLGVFMGFSGAALEALLSVQAYASLLAAVACGAIVAVFLSAFGLLAGWRELWRRLPHWLLFAAVVVNSLVAMGELSYLLIHTLTDNSVPWRDHVPLAAALSGSLTVCAAYAASRWRGESESGAH